MLFSKALEKLITDLHPTHSIELPFWLMATISTQWPEMMRGTDGKLMDLRELGLPPKATTNAENPLLEAFVAGYQFVMKGRVN